MRTTAIPPLRDLNSAVVLRRCEYCHTLVISHEVCESSEEADACPPRALVDALAAGMQAKLTGNFIAETRETVSQVVSVRSQSVAETPKNCEKPSPGESQDEAA